MKSVLVLFMKVAVWNEKVIKDGDRVLWYK
jgi:hypothetical protein